MGNPVRDLDKPASLGQRAVIGLLRVVLPPQVDNEQAAGSAAHRDRPAQRCGQMGGGAPGRLDRRGRGHRLPAFPSPIRSPIFNPGKTSRINVAHFAS
ncbi:MAG: hypothetical protein R2854_06375 [Caldilineaceae bacterium]